MIHGILNIYKEKGFTSHDVVAKLRGILKQKKIGHTGTLDPDALGVLPVCIGKATKLCDMLTDKQKEYEAILLLGKVTDTQDLSGKILKESEIQNVTADQVLECVNGFIGEYMQIPPMYSALKVKGKKLYELAREGKEVERKARKIAINSIDILKLELPRVYIRVSCSKGTYIRTLCHDIGEKLGCGGCMESLLRTKSGQFMLKDSLKLKDIEKAFKDGTLMEHIITIEDMFLEYKSVTVKKEKSSLIHNGNPFFLQDLSVTPTDAVKLCADEKVRVYDADKVFIGLYQYHIESEEFKIVKMFYEKNEPA